MKSSDYFASMVGERALHYNPAALALYKTLKGWEDHHAEQHKDCEDRSAAAVRLAMSMFFEKPLAIAGKSAETKSAE